jgi:acetate kinase
MVDAVIVLNAGSTSVKFGAYGVDATRKLPLLCRGQMDSMQGNPHFVAKDENGKALDAQEWGKGHAIDHETAMRFVVTWLESKVVDLRIVAAGHRIVLGGTPFAAPTRIEGDVLDYLESLTTSRSYT